MKDGHLPPYLRRHFLIAFGLKEFYLTWIVSKVERYICGVPEIKYRTLRTYSRESTASEKVKF